MKKAALGLLTATGAEARFVLGWNRCTDQGGGSLRLSDAHSDVDLLALRSGVGLQSTISAVRRMIQKGAAGLVCLGVAGGLSPGLRPGEIVIGETVLERDKTGTGAGRWDTDPLSVQFAYNTLKSCGIRTWKGTIISTCTAVLGAEEKGRLYRKTKALAVDMESAAVARIAGESKVPLLVLRAVCDPQERTLDRDLTGCLDQEGRIHFSLVCKNVLHRPSLVFGMVPTARDFFLALLALRRAWQVLLKNDLPLRLAGRSMNENA